MALAASISRCPSRRGACSRPRSLRASVYTSTASNTKGSRRRRNSGEMTVTTQAPAKEPANPAAAAGHRACQRSWTRRLYCTVANAVPQTEALLLMPNSVAGWVVGKAANSAGTRTSPPPPTMESTKPARAEASETNSNSMQGLSCSKKERRRIAAPCVSSRVRCSPVAGCLFEFCRLALVSSDPACAALAAGCECTQCSGLPRVGALGLTRCAPLTPG